MKVLWLTNNACSALELLDPGNTRGGWLASLEKELSCLPDTQLHIGFYHGEKRDTFIHGNTTFHPLLRSSRKNKITRYLSRLFGSEYNDQHDLEQFQRLVDDVQPDIIHIHGTEENFGLIQGYRNIPSVFSIQGLINPYMEKFYSGIPTQIADRYESYTDKLAFRSARYAYGQFKKRAEREARVLRNAQFIIGRTAWDKAVTRLMAQESIYFTGQEMLRPSFYTKRWHNTPWRGTLKIITVTGDSLYKGFETIVKSAQLLKDCSGFDFVWYVAGLNADSYCVRVVNKWLRVDLNSLGIKLLSNQTEKQLSELLSTSDIFCQVSHIENSPNSLCEAQLVGMPIIASNAGGTNSLINHSETGILVQDGDSFSLAGEITQAYRNFNTCQLMADRGREAAIIRHNKSEIKNQYVNIYRQILS